MTGPDLATYTTRFSDLSALCPGMVNLKPKKVERYIWGLTPQTQGNVLAVKPLFFDSAKCVAQTLIDHGDSQDSVIVTPEQPKEDGSKKKFWNKRKGQSS